MQAAIGIPWSHTDKSLTAEAFRIRRPDPSPRSAAMTITRRFAPLALGIALTVVPAFAGKTPTAPTTKPTYSTPTLSCTASTGNTITVQVCAGATGAPSGFTLQWLTAADFGLTGWS